MKTTIYTVSWITYKDRILHRIAKHHDGDHFDEIDCVNRLVMIYLQVVSMILVDALYIFWNIMWFVCLFVCLFVCCYKPSKSLLRLPPWARKTPGSISTRATLFLRSYQRYTTAQNWFVCCWLNWFVCWIDLFAVGAIALCRGWDTHKGVEKTVESAKTAWEQLMTGWALDCGGRLYIYIHIYAYIYIYIDAYMYSSPFGQRHARVQHQYHPASICTRGSHHASTHYFAGWYWQK